MFVGRRLSRECRFCNYFVVWGVLLVIVFAAFDII